MSTTNQKPEPDTLDFLLANVSRLHHNRVHALLGELGLFRGQPPILFNLWEQDGLTHTELAERLNVSPATISRMIQRMEAAGFVANKPDPEDQRISRVFLTEAGHAIRTRLEAVRDTMEEETFAGFTEDELVLLRRFLHHIRENLERVSGGTP